MKPNFAGKKNKAKKSKAAKKAAKKKAGTGEDADMADTHEDQEIDYTMPEASSAKNKLKTRMEMKVALKAKVKLLKHSRSKLTKLPAGAAAKQQEAKKINKEIKELLKEQTKNPAAVTADAAGMEQ